MSEMGQRWPNVTMPRNKQLPMMSLTRERCHMGLVLQLSLWHHCLITYGPESGSLARDLLNTLLGQCIELLI